MKHHESVAQRTVAYWLRQAGIFFCAVPNGGKRNRFEAGRMKSEGVTAGAPDLLIFDAPPCADEYRGVALEMKKPDGDKPTPSQRAFLADLEARGWLPLVAYGAADAFKQLTALGFKGLPQ